MEQKQFGSIVTSQNVGTILSKKKFHPYIYVMLSLLVAVFIGIGTLMTIVNSSPSTGSKGADFLRNTLGPKPVAYLEATIFTIQDSVTRLEYKFGLVKPTDPWAIISNHKIAKTDLPAVSLNTSFHIPSSSTDNSAVFQNSLQTNPAPPKLSKTTNSIQILTPKTAGVASSGVPNKLTATLSPKKTQIQKIWPPTSLKPLGNMPSEGVWAPYITDQSGHTVAYKTFLQPDPKRPYVVVGIVAFDLSHVRLNYQLGTNEPVTSGNTFRTGQIPTNDLQSGALLAAFNGGFKTINGHYGVFDSGKLLVPIINHMGTIAVYKDHHVAIGEWGVDLTYSKDMVFFRQNCPLMVHNGSINPLVYNNSVNDWGGTFSGKVVTFRSGIGISQDGRILYYFAGQSLTMPYLAAAMLDSRAYQAMQLDINNYYVLFTKFIFQTNKISAIPLLPKEMTSNINRFLSSYYRDFFYLTSAN